MADSRYAGEAGLQAVFGQIKAALAEKQDKVNDMGLSHNDYSDEEKQKNAQNASDIVSLNNDIDDIVEKRDGDATLYQFAPVVTVEDAVPGNVALRAKVEPTQDLHGYDKPWVGGAGKNILPLTTAKLKADNVNGTWNGNVYSYRGIDFTITEDNGGNIIEIDVNGTSNTDFAGFNLLNVPITQGNYKLNGISGGSQSTLRFDLDGIGSYKTLGDGEIDVYVTDPTDTYTFSIMVRTSGTTVSHHKVYPMLRLSTESATFEPYTNICPVTKYDSCKITRTGNNICPNGKDSSKGYIASSMLKEDGTIENNSYQYVTEFFKVNGGNTYTASQKSTFMNSASVCFYDKDKNYISGQKYSQRLSFSITAPSNAVYARMSQATQSPNMTWMNSGSVAYEYEPYKGNNYQIELNGNVYYGKVRIDTQGNTYFDIDRRNIGMDTRVWTYDATYNRFGTTINTMAVATTRTLVMQCDCYENISDGRDLSLVPNGSIYNGGGGSTFVYVHDNRFTDGEQLRAALSGLYFCYPLATPFTIVLKDTPINLVKGRDTIYADIGDVEVTVNNTIDAIGSVQEQANNLVDDIVDRFNEVIGWSNCKNKLPQTLDAVKRSTSGGSWSGNVYTNNGVTFEVQYDDNGCISGYLINGTPTSGTNGEMLIYNSTNITGNKLISLGTTGSGASFYLKTYNSGWGQQHSIVDKDITSDSVGKVSIIVIDGYTANNVLVKPMICDADRDANYEPYHEVLGKVVNNLVYRIKQLEDANEFDLVYINGYGSDGRYYYFKFTSPFTGNRKFFIIMRGGQNVNPTLSSIMYKTNNTDSASIATDDANITASLSNGELTITVDCGASAWAVPVMIVQRNLYNKWTS